ncbi:MAG: hypothetical protein ACXVC1_08200 [Tumebacillaceae bacterium]
MRSRECRPKVMDEHYKRHFGMVLKLERYYRGKSDEELRLIYAELVREQQMIGNIPLLASTTPVIFLIFGGHVNKYFPHDSFGWLLIVALSILIITWSINHHFRKKGRVGLDAHIVEQIRKERSQNQQTPVE